MKLTTKTIGFLSGIVLVSSAVLSFKNSASASVLWNWSYSHECRAWEQETLPSTQKFPRDLDDDLDIDLEDKLDDKVSQLSQQFGVPQSKVRQIILSLVNQALEPKVQESP